MEKQAQSSEFKTQSYQSKAKTELKYRSYQFSIEVIRFLKELPNERVFWVISDQLLRSATSVGANIIEAKAASSKRDFIKFYEISLKSANETKYWLGLLRDATEIDKEPINKLLSEITEIARMLSASIITMKGRR